MRIAVLHDEVGDAATLDVQDVLHQVRVVEAALAALGHESVVLPCGMDLEVVRRALVSERPDLVFNLVESTGGYGAMIQVIPSLLEALSIPYTGASMEALGLTSNKITAKRRLLGAGLRTAPWVTETNGFAHGEVAGAHEVGGGRWILKPVWEHASVGLDASAVVEGRSLAHLQEMLRERALVVGHRIFAERFIDGREVNVGLLGGPDGVSVLPPAEICFEDFPDDRPRIVDYRAKWVEDSFEYTHTPRSFAFSGDDESWLAEVRWMAEKAWVEFGLSGYARVDFRIDDRRQPWILEINTNPCLSPDAGFAAALARAGIDFGSAVGRIVRCAIP
ncbi:MAG: D-alanine--D-alanine ligase [Deltaproteobacteria bacterium]|nr:D-alanine--D-alanine ligase [Deltaproteobacteria bacterium]